MNMYICHKSSLVAEIDQYTKKNLILRFIAEAEAPMLYPERINIQIDNKL